MSNQCNHGQLARVCDLRENNQEIERLRAENKRLWALAKYGRKCLSGEESESDLSELGLMSYDRHAGIWIETKLAQLPEES